MTIDELISKNRETNADYHIFAGKTWRDRGYTNLMHAPLVYAAFEYRCAIERVVLELFIIMQYESITSEELSTIGSFSSLIKLVHKLAGGNRLLLMRVLKFNQILSEFAGLPKTLSIPDVGRLHKYWSKLSNYCHRQIEPAETWENDKWIKKGYKLLDELYDYFEDILVNHFFGAFSTERLPAEVTEQKELYMTQKIDDSQLKTRLQIMRPILRARRFGINFS